MSVAQCSSPVRSALIVFTMMVLALIGAGSARADIPWSACPTAGYECARVAVPLDRSGKVGGSISLAVTRARATSNPRNAAVVGLAGGPGQAALPLATDFAEVLAPAIADRDLLVFDQRGTGSSGALSCRALRTASSLMAAVSGCAKQLGAGRGSYRTADSVEDIEALRAAAGYEKLVLFGVSYGTKVALAYATAHPDRVEALVLDSVVLPEGPDPFARSTLATAPRVLRDLCADGVCRGATADVRTDLKRLAAKLRAKSLSGKVVTGSARKARYAMGQTELVDILVAGDLNPTLRAELPGSMRAALRGDPAPLLRLSVRAEGLTTGAAVRRGQAIAPAGWGWAGGSGDSDALYLATICEEVPFPWSRTAGTLTRARQGVTAANKLPRAQLGPFSPRAALQSGPMPFCLSWPNASPAPAAPGTMPPVRTLVLDGQMDLRTPFEDAAGLASRIPGASAVQVPYTGHSVLSADVSSCARDALATFFAGGAPAACPPSGNPFAPTPRPPTGLGGLKAIGAKGRVGRTLAAVNATVTDARRQIIGDALALGRAPAHVGGLRAGRATVTGMSGFRLERYQYVPGVVVSGTVPFQGTAKLTVHGGGAARGLVRVSASGAVSGRLGGHKLAVRAGAAAASRLPTLRQALARPRLLLAPRG
jgi:pimeloyl-ACP methyl ester carboxylesterase